jgi:hypothetical protein
MMMKLSRAEGIDSPSLVSRTKDFYQRRRRRTRKGVKTETSFAQTLLSLSLSLSFE